MATTPKTGHEMENRNVSFINSPFFYVFYVLLILLFRVVLFLLPIPQALASTAIHLLHSVLTFRLLHWNKGSPVIEDAVGGQYDQLTFWEQIDDGTQFTFNRKIFTIIPVLIFLWASYDTNWQVEWLTLNSICLAIILIGKSPYMHKVRILGINSN